MRRRALVAGGTAASLGALGGCGFHPLYLPASGGKPGAASAGLAAVYVPVIAERAGQLLRQALQRRTAGSGSGVAKRYELVAAPALASEAVAIQRDTSTTRVRLVGTATWSVRELNLQHTVLLSGTSRVVDGYNVLNQQYFAADLESEAAVKRIMETMADLIVARVAIYFDRQPGTAPA